MLNNISVGSLDTRLTCISLSMTINQCSHSVCASSVSSTSIIFNIFFFLFSYLHFSGFHLNFVKHIEAYKWTSLLVIFFFTVFCCYCKEMKRLRDLLWTLEQNSFNVGRMRMYSTFKYYACVYVCNINVAYINITALNCCVRIPNSDWWFGYFDKISLMKNLHDSFMNEVWINR